MFFNHLKNIFSSFLLNQKQKYLKQKCETQNKTTLKFKSKTPIFHWCFKIIKIQQNIYFENTKIKPIFFENGHEHIFKILKITKMCQNLISQISSRMDEFFQRLIHLPLRKCSKTWSRCHFLAPAPLTSRTG